MKIDNPIILGGAGSSGSTLLITILNRNPAIAAGPELSLLNKAYFFNKPFSVIQKKAPKIVQKGLCTNGWFLYPRFAYDKYGYSADEAISLIRNTNSQKEFLDVFFENYLEKQGKQIWAEKTPSNAYCFEEILDLYPNARIIHIYRDGKDVITSFIKRGMSPYYATMLWLYNSAFALKFKDHPNYYGLPYESLVQNPDKEIKALCNFLQIPYSQKMLEGKNNENTKINSWNQTPGSKISNSSIGKHQSFLTSYHYYVFYHTAISKAHQKKYKLNHFSATDVQQALGYTISDKEKQIARKTLPLLYFVKMGFTVIQDIITRYYKIFKYDKRVLSYPGRIISGQN